MGNAVGWKIATSVFAATTAVLALLLVLRPDPTVHVETVEVVAPRERGRESRPERSRERVTPRPSAEPIEDVASEPKADPNGDPNGDPSDDLAGAPTRMRLAGLSVDEVCRQELLSGGSAPRELVVERLLQDRERASELMQAWLAKRDDPRWKELGLALSPHFYTTFLAVAGDEAAPPLRTLWRATRDQSVMAALLLHGDGETLRMIDEDHRQAHPRRIENPYLLVTLGDPAREMVWDWIGDPSLDEGVRTTAIGGMWVRGTDEDRLRLWAEMDDTIRVLHFAPHAVTDENDWSARIRERVEVLLVDPDPYLRLHGARSALQNRFQWGDELAHRAAETAAGVAHLDPPDGRKGTVWKALLSVIERERKQLPSAGRDEARIREALGLE